MTTRMNGIYVAAFALALSLAPGQARAQVPCVDINAPAAATVQAVRAQLDNVGATTGALGQLITNPSGNTPQDLLNTLNASVNGTVALLNIVPLLSGQVGSGAIPATVNSLSSVRSTVSGLASFLGAVMTVSSLPLPPVSLSIPSIPGLPAFPGTIVLPLPTTLPLPSPFDPATLTLLFAQLVAVQQQLNSIVPTICQ